MKESSIIIRMGKWGQQIWMIGLMVAAYFLAGKLGHYISDIYGGASPVWPASAIGISLTIFFGRRALLAVFLAQLLIRFSFDWSFHWPSLLIATGASLEAYIGARLFNCLDTRLTFLRELWPTAKLLSIALFAPLPSALLGTVSIYLSGFIGPEHIRDTLITWWIGNVMGIVCLLPLLVDLLKVNFRYSFRKVRIAILASILFSGIAALIFSMNSVFLLPLIFPVLFFVCLLENRLATQLSLLGGATAAIVLTILQFGPFIGKSLNANLIDLNLFLFSLAIVAKATPAIITASTRRIATFSLGIGWLAMTSIFWFLASKSQMTDDAELKAMIVQRQGWVMDRLHIYENAFRSAVGFFKGSNEVEPHEWKDFVDSSEVMSRFPGLLGMGVIFDVQNNQLKDFKELMRVKFGVKDFEIKAVPPNLIKDQKATHPQMELEYQNSKFIISFTEPLHINRQALGLDISSENDRKVAAIQSREKNQFVVSAPITLVQKELEGYGFLAFVPLLQKVKYKMNSELKMNAWIYAPVIYHEFLSRALSLNGLFNIRVYDQLDDGKNIKVFEVDERKNSQAWKTVATTTIDFAGRKLKMEWMPGPNFPTSTSSTVAWTGFIGVVLSLLLAGLVTSLYANERKAKAIADQMTDHLNQRNIFLQNLMDLNPVGIYRADLEGKCTYINRKLSELLGLSSEESMGDAWRKSIHPDDRTRLFKAWSNLLSGGEFYFEYRYINQKTQETVEVASRAIRLFNSNGEPIEILGTVEDLREIRQQQQRLVEASRLSSLGEMAAGIAHEVNNPLAIILGAASMLENRLESSRFEPEYAKKKLELIQKTAKRIAKIIHGLRTYAREGSQDNFEWVSLNGIVENTLELCRERFYQHDIHLRLSIQPHIEILAREVQISQVLINLLNNAYDAVKNYSEKWISLEVKIKNNRLGLTICDSGKGIPANLREKIMQPFFTTKEVGQGTGLGLSISSSLIREHGGLLYLDPQNANTCFRIEFSDKYFRISDSELSEQA